MGTTPYMGLILRDVAGEDQNRLRNTTFDELMGNNTSSNIYKIDQKFQSQDTTLNLKANNSEVLTKTNTTAYTPTSNYHPATVKFVTDNAASKANATTSAAGLMSSADKSKLDGVAIGATANSKSTTSPKMNGIAAIGSETAHAAGDHVHPSDTSKMSTSGGTFTGQVIAQSNTSYTTFQIRNSVLSTATPSGGSNGYVWFQYT